MVSTFLKANVDFRFAGSAGLAFPETVRVFTMGKSMTKMVTIVPIFRLMASSGLF